MRSRLIIENTLLSDVDVKGKNQTLAEMYISANKLRGSFRNNSELKTFNSCLGQDRTKFNLLQDSLLDEFHKTLLTNVFFVDKLGKKFNIVIVKVISKNGLFAKCFAEILVKEVSEFYV